MCYLYVLSPIFNLPRPLADGLDVDSVVMETKALWQSQEACN